MAPPIPPGLLAQIERIEDDLTQRRRKAADAATRVHSSADSEAVHDLRVALRRLNASLRMWRDLLRPKATRRARQRLRSLRRALGPVRELEVDVSRLTKLEPELPAVSRVAVEAVLLKLHNRLDRRRRSATRAADSRRIGRIERSVSRAADALSERVVAAPEPRLVAGVHVDQARNEAVMALAIGFESDDDAQLHAGRVALKKWRYALESAAILFDPGVPLQPLRDLQRLLGDAHDFAMLRDRLERRAERLRVAGMTTHADALGPVIATIAGERGRLVDEARRARETLAPFSDAGAEPRPARPVATRESGRRTT